MGKETTSASWNKAARTGAVLAMSVLVLAGCTGNSADVQDSTKFSSDEMGVSASPRLTSSGDVPKGGGRYQVGKRYKIAGRWYQPREQPDLDVTGRASWYGPNFHGRKTANGEVFDQYHLSAAHPTLPLPSYVRVTNLSNDRSALVRVNDRGPYAHDRLIDLSRRSAQVLGFINNGTANVRVEYVGPAPVDGDDTNFLVASIDNQSMLETGQDTRVAYQDTRSQDGSLDAIGSLVDGLANGESASPALGYADPQGGPVAMDVFAAHEAAVAATPRDGGLSRWHEGIDEDARAVDVALGTFVDPAWTQEVITRFATIAAVDEYDGQIAGRAATVLRLRHLKPGVTHEDVRALAAELGLAATFL